MISEPKIEAEKEAYRFPALVSLAPKRRFRPNPPPATEEETGALNEETPRPAHRQRLKRTGRVVLRWPCQGTSFAAVPPAPLTIRS